MAEYQYVQLPSGQWQRVKGDGREKPKPTADRVEPTATQPQGVVPEIPIRPAPSAASWADAAKEFLGIQWAWECWLAKGFVTALVSESGKGKSALALRIAACYILGLAWPDGTPFTEPKSKVLWCESESAHYLNITRAQAWGIPLGCIVTPTANVFENISLDVEAHRRAIIAASKRDDVGLIVLDSLSGATLARDENTTRMLAAVRFMADVARDSQKPVIITHHLRKRSLLDGGALTLDRVRGSTAIAQVTRVVWALDNPNAESDGLRLSVIKSNLSTFPSPLGMTIVDDGVHFGDAPTEPVKKSALDRALDFLECELAGGARRADDVLADARLAGVSERTLYRARDALKVLTSKSCGVLMWQLPMREANTL